MIIGILTEHSIRDSMFGQKMYSKVNIKVSLVNESKF